MSASLSASLMQFYKQASPELQRRMDYFQKNLMFAEPEVSVSLLRGILLVRADLSTTNAPYTDVPGPDDRLEEKALPILAPENERTDDGKLRVLIGAPLVMCDENTFYYLGDTKRIKEETRDYNYFQTDKVTKIERYFTEKKIGSFVSLPLQDSSGEKIGVLNFDSSLPNMIPEDLVENFTSTSHVITGILSELFLLLLQKEQALPGAELPRMEEPVAVELPQVEEPVKSREKTGGPEVTKGMAQSQDSEKVTKKRRKRRRRQKKDR